MIFIENDLQGYKLSCCGGFALDFFSFIQIDVGHAVAWQTKLDSRSYYPQWVEMFYFKEEAFLFFLYTVFKRIDRLHEE